MPRQSEAPEQTPHHSIEIAESGNTRPGGWARIVAMVLGAVGLVMAVNQVFLLNLFGFQPLGNSYLYYLIGIFLSVAFIVTPARKGDTATRWYDWVLVAITLACGAYLGMNGLQIIAMAGSSRRRWPRTSPPSGWCWWRWRACAGRG